MAAVSCIAECRSDRLGFGSVKLLNGYRHSSRPLHASKRRPFAHSSLYNGTVKVKSQIYCNTDLYWVVDRADASHRYPADVSQVTQP